MVRPYSGDTKGINAEGLLHDIQEDDGYEHYDLVLTVLEYIVQDVQELLSSSDRDKLYALIGLVSEVDSEALLQYLPKDNNVYLPELCGGLRLESYLDNVKKASQISGESE